VKLATIHRRLVILMALSGLVAFGAGAGLEPMSAIPAGTLLFALLFWHPTPAAVAWVERLMVPVALLLAGRALLVAAVLGGDVVIPVVDLLLVLLCVEVIRSSDAVNDVRLYALTFALVLAATAYRPGVLFASSFLLFIVIGSATLAIGLIRRKSIRFRAPEAVLDRSFVVSTLGLSVVTFAMAVAVFVTFPRVSRTWPGRGDVAATSIAGFSDRISLGQHGATIMANPEVVLRVEFPDGRPDDLGGLRWRGLSFDRFDGVTWTRSDPQRSSRASETWYRVRWPEGTVAQRITAAPLDVPVLFGLHPIQLVDSHSSLSPLQDEVGDWFYFGRPPQPRYTSFSTARSPDAEALRNADGSFVPDPAQYLQLPDLPDRIAALADSLTAPHDTQYDRVAAVHRYLNSEFGYTRELPRNAAETSLDHFLFERREGHCEYFSSAMVVLLRAAGIHARNVNGFLGGEWNEFGDFLSVSQNAAHSWVEVWFPGYGWVEWDPTPPGSGATSAGTGWRLPGHLWFAGLSYRWSQWVLEYDLAAQVGVFDRIGGIFDSRGPGEARGLPGGLWIWLTAGAVLIVVARRRLTGGGRKIRPESRVWRAFVQRAMRRGLVDSDATTPAVLLARIESERPEALPAAERLVDLYQRLRFAGDPVGSDDLAHLRRTLAEAKRAVS
jgi:transglutaminase-like putative cysteine protease